MRPGGGPRKTPRMMDKRYVDIKCKKLGNNASRDRQCVKGNKVMAKWPLRGRDVAGNLMILELIVVVYAV